MCGWLSGNACVGGWGRVARHMLSWRSCQKQVIDAYRYVRQSPPHSATLQVGTDLNATLVISGITNRQLTPAAFARFGQQAMDLLVPRIFESLPTIEAEAAASRAVLEPRFLEVNGFPMPASAADANQAAAAYAAACARRLAARSSKVRRQAANAGRRLLASAL